jgi:hypothetical protein
MVGIKILLPDQTPDHRKKSCQTGFAKLPPLGNKLGVVVAADMERIESAVMLHLALKP